MENNPSNRMATTRKRGRLSNEEILERDQPTPVEFIGDTTPKLPPVRPMIGKCCGRGMTPKVEHTTKDKRYVRCAFCSRKMVIDYSKQPVPLVTLL